MLNVMTPLGIVLVRRLKKAFYFMMIIESQSNLLLIFSFYFLHKNQIFNNYNLIYNHIVDQALCK
jgi:hypothetical protein